MKGSTKMLVEAGILIALAQILSYRVYEAPFGGSVTAGSLVPILIFAIRWGVKPGLLAGATGAYNPWAKMVLAYFIYFTSFSFWSFRFSRVVSQELERSFRWRFPRSARQIYL
jgi:thiamine transporter ThiT